jgi:hypothetical protein
MTDDAAVRRLARLDSARPLREPVLLAEDGGRPVAALSLADGRVVADPFRRTRDAVAMLRLRAAQLEAAARAEAAPRRLRRRLPLPAGS